MDSVNQERVEAVVEWLVDTPKNIIDVATPEELESADFLDAVYACIFECERCGWWFEHDDESPYASNTCIECGPDAP